MEPNHCGTFWLIHEFQKCLLEDVGKQGRIQEFSKERGWGGGGGIDFGGPLSRPQEFYIKKNSRK